MEGLARPLLFVFLAVLLVLSNHSIHSKFWRCQQRTDTRKQTFFSLSPRYPVTYDFTVQSPHIEIRVLPYGRWRSDELFHDTVAACARLKVLEGGWYLLSGPGGSRTCYDGCVAEQQPRSFLSWAKIGKESEAASLRLTADTSFYHTLCSATQDADRYFSLCSTPLWLRVLFHSTYVVPFGSRIRKRMIKSALWYQLRVVYGENDSWTSEGSLPMDSIYIWPPEWAERLQFESQFVISKMVVKVASWIGRKILGMKGKYPEYEWVGPESNSE
jgi:hypothetical protein